MQNSILRVFCLLFILTACQPMEFSGLHLSPDENLLNLGSTKKGATGLVAKRSIQKEFKDVFTSDKLDLVFVLDSHPDMQSFYKKNLFGSDFLNRLQSYDWKLAWTDMSVDIQSLKDREKGLETESSCGLFSGLLLTTAAVLTAQPTLFGFGLNGISNCVSSGIAENGQEVSFSNGSFLEFEQAGSKIQSEGFPQLKADVENYQTAFDHTFRLGNKKSRPAYSTVRNSGARGLSTTTIFSRAYEAPVTRNVTPYPFLSMAFSMQQGTQPLKNPEGQQVSPAFFRKDSLVVYVLITAHDMETEVSAEQFRHSVDSFFGSEKRVKVIPVTLTKKSNMICRAGLSDTLTGAPKLVELAKDLGHNSLDICSPELGSELFDEISKSLYSIGTLSQ